MNIADFLTVTGLVLLAKKLVDFLRFAAAKDWSSVVSQVTAWVGAIAILALAAQTDFAQTFKLGDLSLDAINGWTLVYIGLCIGSGAGGFTDFLKAIDGTQSARVPAFGDEVIEGRIIEPTRLAAAPGGTVVNVHTEVDPGPDAAALVPSEIDLTRLDPAVRAAQDAVDPPGADPAKGPAPVKKTAAKAAATKKAAPTRR